MEETELKPCPFCGSDKTEVITDIEDGLTVYEAWCSQCCASTGRRFADADEAAESWNHRTERTCKMAHVKSGPLYDVWRCSECLAEFAENRTDGHAWFFDPYYCPNCGAKVVE